jgi:5-formyltetrahydrofolate cyclo-ligase
MRLRVWDLLEHHQAVPGHVHGTIPDFHGKQQAAQRLAELPAWRNALVIKAVPDKAQYPARVLALRQGKTVYMAVPRLAAERPFYVLNPAKLSISPE